MEAADRYKFLPIQVAVKCINQTVNITGIIAEFSLPKRSRGTDYYCTLRIIDESYQKPGMLVNIFAGSSQQLPNVVERGDIVQLFNVMVTAHGDGVNAVFNKKFSSFALYNGKDTDDFVPYQVSSKFPPRDKDKMLLAELRKWLLNSQLIQDSHDFPMLRETKEGNCCSLVCKILLFCEAANQERMVFVWDGTDLPPNSISAKLEDELHNHLPLHHELVPLPRELLCAFPTVGSILRIAYDQSMEKSHLKHLENGRWVKFVNMRLEVHAGLWHGVLTPSTKLRYIRNDDDLIKQRESLYGERMSKNMRRMPFWSFPWPSPITVVDHDDARLNTLMDVLTHSEVTAKYKCIVRVVAAMPWSPENFLSEHGIYVMRLTLEDPTARIHAFVYAEDGETLFDGYPSNAILTQKMNSLLGVILCDDSIVPKCAFRNPPWVQVCLKSYYTSKHDIWGSRQYRIFDTKIVPRV
ncbi:protection of telomeres protein 1b-like isoform X2 [Prosopis cineraria]|uniref:protection of telomeres protein 1b-like isoform X2 n=1 Tax=Prosopis cineraria TaxID=364024 RepID=UPI002410090A|nr:protection of telomeres protein 1b-like isoform X2 [Prosopis cineraria]